MCLIQDAGFECVICGSPETFLNSEEEAMMCGGCDSVIPEYLIVQPSP
jgi:transcription initiation factor TFIIIB Brf1 subunit/transcription initiation factor TFIIB